MPCWYLFASSLLLCLTPPLRSCFSFSAFRPSALFFSRWHFSFASHSFTLFVMTLTFFCLLSLTSSPPCLQCCLLSTRFSCLIAYTTQMQMNEEQTEKFDQQTMIKYTQPTHFTSFSLILTFSQRRELHEIYLILEFHNIKMLILFLLKWESKKQTT